MKHYVFDLEPVAKPRMTQQDKWVARKCTTKYWQFKSDLQKLAMVHKFQVPAENYHLKFYISMPKGWSNVRRALMEHKPHQATPDKDNLEKGFLDALCDNDAYIFDGRASKYWAYKGRIEVIVS